MTKEEFIEKARKVHGDKYDYSKVEYVKSSLKVIITCKEHGDFLQAPASHLRGHGYPKCSCEENHKNTRMTREGFIEKAKKVHGDEYNYDSVEYVNNSTKVKIYCNTHGFFYQIPRNHCQGDKCPKCAKELAAKNATMTKDEFVNRSNIRHNNFYNYDKVVYTIGSDKVIITCPIHGDFIQTPYSHLHSSGCPKCGRIRSNTSKMLSTEDSIEKSKEIHGDKYDYSLVKYNGYDNKVDIICKVHGKFQQTPDSHLQGQGCSMCAVKTSNNETELKEFLNKNGIETIKRCRDIIKPYEIDIYSEKCKIGIEYNGLYWHSEDFGKDKYYHINKLNKCKEQGIKLIQIFEDEYVNNKDIVEHKLLHLFGKDSCKEKAYGRKCVIKEIDYSTSKEFLDKFHIQGGTR